MSGTTRKKHVSTSLYDATFHCKDIFRNNTKLQYISPTCHCNVIAALFLQHIVASSETFSVFLLLTKTWKQKNWQLRCFSLDTDTFDWNGGERTKKGRRRMFPLFYWWIIRGAFGPLACCLIFRAITNLAELAGWSQGSPVVCSPTLIQRSKQSLPWPSSTPPPPPSPSPPTPALSLILGQSPPPLYPPSSYHSSCSSDIWGLD